MAKELVRRGHQVQVLTGFPNYPGGKVYPGYRIRPWQREVIDGVPVTRVALYPSHDKSSLRRAFNYGSFAVTSSLLAPILVDRPDVAYVYNPMGLPGLVLNFLKGVPFVYDIQDLWPDSLVASGMMANRRVVMGTLSLFFNLIYRKASHVLVLSPGFREVLVARGVSRAKVSVIYNWCDEENIHPVRPDPDLAVKLGMNGRLNIVYAGNVGRPQGLQIVLDAAVKLQASCPTVLFSLIGTGTELESLQRRALEMGLANVQFLTPVPPAEIRGFLAQADALFLHLKDDPLFRITIPSKTQTYMAMGKPLIAGVNGNAKDLIQQSGGGWCFNPGNIEELVATVGRFCQMTRTEHMAIGDKAKQFYDQHLALSVAATQFEEIFLSVVRHAA
jgi:glycosyltransferase involved in cell wall biosynthesis